MSAISIVVLEGVLLETRSQELSTAGDRWPYGSAIGDIASQHDLPNHRTISIDKIACKIFSVGTLGYLSSGISAWRGELTEHHTIELLRLHSIREDLSQERVKVSASCQSSRRRSH